MATAASPSLLENCRASSLSCHSSASLITMVRKSVDDKAYGEALAIAAKQMRQAEALCRSAASALAMFGKPSGQPNKAKKGKNAGNGGGGDLSAQSPTPASLSRSARRRQRRSKSRGNKATVKGMDVEEPVVAAPALVDPMQLAETATMLQTMFGAATSSAGSVLNPAASQHFPVGTRVFVANLTSRQELNNQGATVAVDDKLPDGRIAIAMDGTGEKIRVKSENVMLSTTSKLHNAPT